MSKEFVYQPKGVCSRQIIFTLDDDVIESVRVIGGCSGNLQGISRLLKGMKINEVIERLDGIKCGMKPTSCPDQIARGLKQYLGQSI